MCAQAIRGICQWLVNTPFSRVNEVRVAQGLKLTLLGKQAAGVVIGDRCEVPHSQRYECCQCAQSVIVNNCKIGG